MNTCEETLAGLEIQNLVIAGDFNAQLSSSMNTSEGESMSHGSAYRTVIHSILADYSLMDIWQIKNPKSVRGTFHRGSYSTRLDYWFIPEYLHTSESSIEIDPDPLSDHSLLVLSLYKCGYITESAWTRTLEVRQ